MDQTADEKPIEHEGDRAETRAETSPVQASKQTGRSKGAIVLAVLAIIVAIVFGVLYFTSRVPGGAAAKLNGSFISESEVTSYIAQYRGSHSLTDDTALAQALASQGLTVAKFRINAIDEIATAQLVNERAKELGISADESQVDDHIAQLKSQLAFNDDSIWERTLQQYGMTEDQVREQYRSTLVQQALCEQEVPRRKATDAETLSWTKTNLAGSGQQHYTALVFSGENSAKQAKRFSDALANAKATSSFASDEGLAEFAASLAKKRGATCEDYAWTIGLEANSEIAEELNQLSVSDTSDAHSDQDAKTTTIYLCDESYTFPASGKIDSLKKKAVPNTLWSAVASKASDALWSSDCSTYVTNLLAQAQLTYYPLPEDAPYKVDVSAAATSSTESSSSSSGSE